MSPKANQAISTATELGLDLLVVCLLIDLIRGLGSTLGLSGESYGSAEQEGFMELVYTLGIKPGTAGAQPTLRKHFYIGQQKYSNLPHVNVKTS